MPHPFLNTDFAIAWSKLKPEAIEPDLTHALEDAQKAIDAIAELGPKNGSLSYETTFAALDAATETLSHAWGLVSHLDSVCNSSELREAHNAMLPKVTEFYAKIPLNDALWATLKSFGTSAAIEQLSPTKQRSIAETLADFREQGADLPAPQKKRAAEIQKRLAAITQKYSENCLDATNAWEKITSDSSLLAGLPESALAAAKQNAADKGHSDAWRFTLQAPSLIPVLTYADNDNLREEVWRAYSVIGRETSHNNQAIVREILDLRHELAQLMGKENFADHVTARRMAGSGENALEFGNTLFEKVETAFQEEAKSLREFKAHATGNKPEPLQPWETAYWAEKQRLANYDFDEEALRPYFPINRVIEGLFHIAQKLFGLRIEARSASEVETWHEEVAYYDLYDNNSNELLGGFYADWHPRESKRGGAWMNYLITGNRDESTGPRTPHLGLICGNLTPAVGDSPALLTHREVETIFHEFGHLLHHLCGEVEVKALNGVNVPWDFVELPSQILENWCWNRESLDLFARHYETGDPIPESLFQKMTAARNYMKASGNVRQLSFGKMDLELHINWQKSDEADLDAYIKKSLQGYSPEYKTEPKSNIFNFSHLFSSPTGYAAGYYSYKWAEVLDADAFTRFQKEGILNPETGKSFRDEVLAKGNSVNPAVLFKNFMHRDPDPDALLRRDGLIA